MVEEPEYLTPLQRRYLARYPTADIAPDQTTFPDPLVGVQGWLAFLAVALIALGPLLTLAMTAAALAQAEANNPAIVSTPAWSSALILSWGSALIYCAISVYAGWRLFNRKVRQTVPIVIACIWIAGPGLAIMTLIVADRIFTSPASAADGASLARPIIFSVIWTTYLLRSKRVKNTYL